MLQCLSLKRKSILLHEQSTMAQITELMVLIQYYHPLYKLHLELAKCPDGDFCNQRNPGSYVVFSCHIPLVSFHLRQLISFFMFPFVKDALV
jgi:hypothetical protein